MRKAVLLLHGWLTDINDFENIIPFLEKNYDHLERITYPGHGEGEDYREFNAEKTFELIESTFVSLSSKYEIIDVIGYSMGGALATYLASNYHFRKLVLLAPANKYFNFVYPFSKIKNFLKLIYAIQKAIIKKDYENKDILKQKIKFILKDDMQSLRFARDKYLKSYFRHTYRNFKNVIKRVNENIKEIKNPCFLAWGKLDQLVPKESIRYLTDKCINNCIKIKTYENLSHLLLLSPNCEELVEDIRLFLEDKEDLLESNFT
jgi:esterase/lipase